MSVVVVDDHGAVVGWPLVIPDEPPLVSIPLHKSRKTLSLIRQEKSFSINLAKDEIRACEIFGRPGEKKQERWDQISRCKSAPCITLGDTSRVVECIYGGELEIEDRVIVLCHAVASYGYSEYAIWDPCSRQQLAE